MIALRMVVATLMLGVAPHASKAQVPLPDVGVIPADWRKHGNALVAANRQREAIAAFEQALKDGGQDEGLSAWCIARSYAGLGNRKQALRWVEQAIDRGFRDRETMRRAPEFAQFRDDPRFSELLKPLDVSKDRVAVLTFHY
jgi:tetratricopeptide (TPR) repeat protein